MVHADLTIFGDGRDIHQKLAPHTFTGTQSVLLNSVLCFASFISSVRLGIYLQSLCVLIFVLFGFGGYVEQLEKLCAFQHVVNEIVCWVVFLLLAAATFIFS